nr:hypothetical protein [Tanacetum cinerariifolium]
MGDEHLNTIPEMKSDEVIKSSVEDLVPIPSESEDTSIVYSPKIDSLLEEFASKLAYIDQIPPGIDETDSDPKDDIRFIEQLLYDYNSGEDDPFEDIDYVEASPPDSELVSLEEVKDEILRAKLLNIHLLIDKIESLNNHPTPDCVLKSHSSTFLSYSDNSLHEFKTFSDHTKETSSGSTTTHVDNSLPEYDLFLFEIEPDQDSEFSPSHDSFGSGNKIFDPRIFIKVQSERLLSREEFYISFIRDPLYPVFKPGILSYLLVSHQDKIIFDFSENPMMTYGEDIPLLDVPFLHFYPPCPTQVWGIEIAPDLEASRARGLVHRPLELQSLAYGNPIS